MDNSRVRGFGFLVIGLAFIGCGGGSSSGGVGSMFCHDWAVAFCHKLWTCPGADGMSPLAGPSEATCTAGWTKSCTDPAPAGQTNDVSCVGANHVNMMAETMCLTGLSTVTCDEFNSATYTQTACDQVCVTTSTTGSGGSTSTTGTGGTTGSGGSVGTGQNSTPSAFCLNTLRAACQLELKCLPAAQSMSLTVDQCVAAAGLQVDCASATCTKFSSSQADTCLTAFSGMSCTDLMNNTTPPVCDQLGC